MRFEGLNGKIYTVARELGKGGEGQVFELQNEPNLVLKLYNEPMSADKLGKLRYMVSIRTPQIETYAAWPVDVVRDTLLKPCGFVMRKLTNYLPLHMLFSPMDRKKLFPDKGYNFLVHVAKNLAIAFHKIHEAGLVAGDVNEGNVLINESGMVAFIDCDSFQVKAHDHYYYCEVGVPRYTPAELLRRGSFDHVVRTVNTDSFSLAVLIFQLLFLGRHPFAGRNNSKEDIDEEKAIREFQFAYSLKNHHKKLLPPNDSFDIHQLPSTVTDLFHHAFEQENNRPLADTWVRALDSLLKNMIVCRISGLHSYPSVAGSCPWCAFRARRGILYFLDNGSTQQGSISGDIEAFINGFKVEQLAFRNINGGYVNPALSAQPIDRKFYRSKRKKTWRLFLLILSSVAASYFTLWAIPVSIIVLLLFTKFWYSRLVRTERRQRRLHFESVKAQYIQALGQYNSYEQVIAGYNKELSKFNQLLNNYRDLPKEFQERKKHMEERIYDKHLHDFMSHYVIRDHSIPQVGAAKKLLLATSGIRTAADITKLSGTKVLGIGPVYHQRLISWQRQVASLFTYIPTASEVNNGIAVIQQEINQLKAKLDTDIRKGHQSVTNQCNNIQSQGAALLKVVCDLGDKLYQAELDMQMFRNRILS